MELASSDAMAARKALPVLNDFSFLFFTGRGDSFLSQRRERKEWGRKFFQRPKKKMPRVSFLQKERMISTKIRACPSADALSQFRDSYALIPLTVIATIAARYATVQAAIVVTIFVRSFASRPASRARFSLSVLSIHVLSVFSTIFTNHRILRLCKLHNSLQCKKLFLHCILHFFLHPDRAIPSKSSLFLRCFRPILHQFLTVSALRCTSPTAIPAFSRCLLQKPAARTHFCAGRPVSLFENL